MVEDGAGKVRELMLTTLPPEESKTWIPTSPKR